jgi:hypothetical protein
MSAHGEAARETPQLSAALWYASLGWSVVPTHRIVNGACSCPAGAACTSKGKHPAVAWTPYQSVAATIEQIRAWFGPGGLFAGHGVGIVTGAVSGFVVVDVDEGPGKAGGETLNDLQFLNGDMPHTVVARTGGGGKHIFLLHPGGVWVTTGRNVLGPGVDVRGDGGFIVAAPSLHESGRYYLWDAACHPRDTPIAAAPAWVVEMAEGSAPDPATGQRAPSTGTTGTGEIVRDSWGRVIDGRERFMVGIVCGVIASLAREADALPTVEAVVAEAWPTYERGARARGASLEADGRGETLMRQRAGHFLRRAEKGKWKLDKREAPPFGEDKGDALMRATPVEELDFSIIQPRRWVYGRELIRGYVSVLASVGGVGKTAYALLAAICMALGLPLLGVTVHGRTRVWVINLEDPLEEMRRRMAAAMRHHKIEVANLAGWLFLDSGRDQPLVVTIRGQDGALWMAPVVPAFVAEIKRRGIGAVLVDPLVHSHTANENDNTEMAFVMGLWARVAHEGDCAVWLAHHFRKGGQGGDADAVRGAGAIQGAVRAMHTLSAMTEEEAERVGVKAEDRLGYIRHDSVKQNMAKAPAKADWYRLVSVPLGNGNLAYPDGDEVQTVERWSPPSPWTGLTWDAVEQILARIVRGTVLGEPCALAKQAGDRWAGHAVMAFHKTATVGQAADILKRWVANGVLVPGEWKAPKTRKTTGCVTVDQGKFQEMRRRATTPETESEVL